jgi:hypothetical protein
MSVWIDTLKDYATGSSEKYQEILEHAGLFVDAINYKNFNRFDADNINNKLARWNDKMFRWSGQNWHVKHAKNGVAVSLARELGNNISKSWDGMHKGFREMLVQYGSFNKEKWDLLKTVAPEMIDGKAYYHPGMVQKIGDEHFEKLLPKELQLSSRPGLEDAQIQLETGLTLDRTEEIKSWEEKRVNQIKREKLKLESDLRTFFVEEGRNAAPEPDAKVRRVMAFGTKSGTKTSEAVKLITQFKTFAFVNWDRSIRGKRMMADSNDYGGLIHHAGATLALGYASTVLKDLARGTTPADPSQGSTWGRAAMQSGGLGIIGDFFGSAYSARSQNNVLSTLAGPTFSTLGAASVLALKAAHGETYEDGSKYAAKWVDLGRSVTPFSTLLWTRATMDHLVWRNLKETLEPGSTARSVRRLRKEYNQKYLINPN